MFHAGKMQYEVVIIRCKQSTYLILEEEIKNLHQMLPFKGELLLIFESYNFKNAFSDA